VNELRVQVDRLVLHGVPAPGREALEAAIRDALGDALAGPAAPPRPPSLALPDQIGGAVAQPLLAASGLTPGGWR
jgi:hypothetical protein